MLLTVVLETEITEKYVGLDHFYFFNKLYIWHSYE